MGTHSKDGADMLAPGIQEKVVAPATSTPISIMWELLVEFRAWVAAHGGGTTSIDLTPVTSRLDTLITGQTATNDKLDQIISLFKDTTVAEQFKAQFGKPEKNEGAGEKITPRKTSSDKED